MGKNNISNPIHYQIKWLFYNFIFFEIVIIIFILLMINVEYAVLMLSIHLSGYQSISQSAVFSHNIKCIAGYQFCCQIDVNKLYLRKDKEYVL